MAVIYAEKGALRPGVIAGALVLWLHDVQDNGYAVLIVVPDNALVGVGSIPCHYSVPLARVLGLLVVWQNGHLALKNSPHLTPNAVVVLYSGTLSLQWWLLSLFSGILFGWVFSFLLLLLFTLFLLTFVTVFLLLQTRVLLRPSLRLYLWKILLLLNLLLDDLR